MFTVGREVKAMCDLVKSETERIDSRFLEPACGEGAFLTEILRRKLSVVRRQYGRSPADYERYAVLAITSLYGVDILEDNAAICRENLYKIWLEEYAAALKAEPGAACREAAQFILRKNILCGDALTMKQNDGEPIEFAEWSFASGDQLKRRDFRLDELLAGQDDEIGLAAASWAYDAELNELIPRPICEHPLRDYREVTLDG